MVIMNFLSSILNNRELIYEMAIRELRGVNKGAFLGYIWLALSPLIQVSAYVIIVTFIFNARADSDSGTFDYVIYILSGMIPWQILTQSLQTAPSLIRTRMELVKQVVYPIETLPLTQLFVSSIGTLTSLVVFLVLSIISGTLNWSMLLLPIPFVLLITFILGFSWIFSLAGILIKDLREIITVLLGLIIYASPVIVNEELVSERVWSVIQLNPLSHVVICFRDVFYAEFHATSWIIFVTMALLAFIPGAWLMNKAKILINEYI